jgi:hypothetical protein
MKKSYWAAATMVVLALLGGCKNSGNDQNSSNLRALNAVVDAEALDLLVDDNVKASAIPLGTTSSYSEFDSGTRDVKVRSAVNQTVLLDKSLSFANGARSTLLIYGKRSAINTLVLPDDTVSPSSGKLRIRLLGLSPDVGPLDLYLTSSDISAMPATLANISYGAVTDFSEVSPGSFRIVFTTAGTKDIVFQSAAAQDFPSGGQMTLAVFPALSGKLVNAVVLTQGSDGVGTFLANPASRVKAVNAIPTSTPLNFKADGATLLSSVPYAGSSSYITTATGAHTLQLEASNVPGTIVATLPQTLEPARDYTAVAVSNAGQPQLVAFVDDNTFPPSGFAKIRFANALTDSTTVDVLVNFASQTSGLAYKSVSSSYPLAAAIYTITFATPGGISVIAALTDVEIDAGAVYTAYLFGSSANPQAKLVRDR